MDLRRGRNEREGFVHQAASGRTRLKPVTGEPSSLASASHASRLSKGSVALTTCPSAVRSSHRQRESLVARMRMWVLIGPFCAVNALATGRRPVAESQRQKGRHRQARRVFAGGGARGTKMCYLMRTPYLRDDFQRVSERASVRCRTFAGVSGTIGVNFGPPSAFPHVGRELEPQLPRPLRRIQRSVGMSDELLEGGTMPGIQCNPDAGPDAHVLPVHRVGR